MGKIITFYSYKGGVGRSMALVNIGVILARWGYKVLVVDWDLEAPGIEFFFKKNLNVTGLEDKTGVIDLLYKFKHFSNKWLQNKSSFTKSYKQSLNTQLLYNLRWLLNKRLGKDQKFRHVDFLFMEWQKVNWHESIMKISLPDSKQPLFFMSAGRQDKDFSRKVRELDVYSFYQMYGGEFFELLRDDLKRSFDFVFIDSRTGVTDIGGVCTVQLPDSVILLFITTEQSFLGTLRIAKNIQNAQQKLPVDRLGVTIVPIPSRFDTTTEHEISQEWIERFAHELSPIYSDLIPISEDPIELQRQFLKKTKIPYIPYFSFGEKLPVIEERSDDPTSLSYAYENIAALVVNDWQSIDMFLKDRYRYVREADRAQEVNLKQLETFHMFDLKKYTLKNYLLSEEFSEFKDVKLRQNACQAVERFLKDFVPVQRSQLYASPSAIQAGGLAALRKLTDNQKQKNTNIKNKKFWEFIYELIFKIPEPEFSMRKCIRNELEQLHLLLDERSADGNVEVKRIRKENKAKIEKTINHALPIYFEHFNCHYFYRTG